MNVAKPAVLHTGKTITDAQIQALRDSLGSRTDRAATRIREICDSALGTSAEGARDAAAHAYDACSVRPDRAKACIWGRCNGTRGADGRCNVCGSKRP